MAANDDDESTAVIVGVLAGIVLAVVAVVYGASAGKAVKPKAAFYIFPKIDVKRFNIHSDEQFALDLLHDKHILISHGGAFNWHRPDHFRVVYLPRIEVLGDAMRDLGDFLSRYRQA